MLLNFGIQWISSLIEFWRLFSQVLMVKSQGMLRSLKSTNGGEIDEHLLLFYRTEPLGKKREPLWRTWKDINTPCLPTVT
jgi:hypothetical protein